MSEHDPFTIGNVYLFNGAEFLTATHIRVDNGVIAAIGDSSIQRESDLRYEAEGAVLLPGLIDSHVHLVPGCTQLSALFGVTTVIDMFSTSEVIDAERELVKTGDRGETPIAADLRTSTVGATAPGGHPSLAYSPIPHITGPNDAEAFVAQRIADGADHLKIMYDDGSGARLNMPP